MPDKRVGLALGGGVVRGLAHIGVLAVLEKAGIPIDYVAGTSVGAIIATAFSAGWPASRIDEHARGFRWHRLIRPALSKRGFFSFEPLANWMRAQFGDLDFDELEKPCAVAVTDIEAGKPVVLRSGRVVPAVQASCSVPGFIAPVELDGRLYGEGGVTNMLPVSALRQMGADYIIAVDLFPFSLREFLGPLGYGLAALEILLQRSGCGVEEADCFLRPDLSGKTYLRFSKHVELYALGRQAAEQELERIRRDLGIAVQSEAGVNQNKASPTVLLA
jgi:NTE family protein